MSSKTINQRFDEKWKLDPITGCWVWFGCKSDNRYGVIKIGEKTYRAHRWALEQILGRKIKPGMKALHKCDVPACVNPQHLFEGTQSENMLDCVKKQRYANGFGKINRTHCSKGHKLTKENTYTCGKVKRGCRACKRENKRKSRHARNS